MMGGRLFQESARTQERATYLTNNFILPGNGVNILLVRNDAD